MAIEEQGICVRILEKELRIACPPEKKQALHEAVTYLNQQIAKVREQGKGIAQENLLAMAALNMSHQMVANRQSLADEAKVLAQKIDEVL